MKSTSPLCAAIFRRKRPAALWRLLTLLLCLAASSSQAGLVNSRGLWDFDGTLDSYWPCFPAVVPTGLTAGADYSFATGSGYSFLQTQSFITAAKRLTVTNNSGVNGGTGATRTNQWSVVMDISFDSLAPFAGILQLDPANSGDVSFYVNGSSGTLTGSLGTLSGSGAISANTWYRLALTCGNNGAGGPLTVKAYLNGVLTGTRTSTFNGAYAMQSAFLMLSDNNGEVRPAKLNSLGLWGEELSATDIATLAGPRSYGLLWPGFSQENCPVLSAAPRALTPGQNLTITYSAPSPLPRDRLALFLDGDALTPVNVKRAIYIGGGASPTTAPAGGMPVMSTTGLAAGCYWLHYLPGDTYISAHRIAIRIDASAPALTVTPSSIYPGGSVSVTGAVPPGSPGARLLFAKGTKDLPFREVSVNEWGQFSVTGVPTPAGIAPGTSKVTLIPAGTTDPAPQTTPVTVTNPPASTLTVQVRRSNIIPGQPSFPINGAKVMVYDHGGDLSGQALTDATGTATVPALAAGTYYATTTEPLSPVREVSVLTATPASTTIQLPPVSITPCEPSAELVALEATTQPGGLFSGHPATKIGSMNQPVFASFANVGAPGSQQIEIAVTVRFDCTNMSVQNSGALTIVPGVRFTLPAPYGAQPVLRGGGTVVNGEDNLRRFTMLVDVAPWPAGTPSLTVEAGYVVSQPLGAVTVTDLSPFPGAAWSFPMKVTDLRPRWASGKATNVSVSAAPDSTTNSINYSFSGLVPTSGVAWEENIDLGLVQLENSITFGCPVNESYSTSGAYSAAATAQAQIRLLSFDIVNESMGFNGLPPLPDGLLGLTYRTPVRNFPLFDQCWAIPGLGIDARKCIKLCFVGCKKCVGISAGAFACIGGSLDVQGRIASDLRAGVTVTPHATLALPIRVQIDAIVCSGGAEIKPQLDFSVPINIDLDPLDGGFGDGCVKLNAILSYYVRCFGFTLFNGKKNLAEKTWGNCPAGMIQPRSAPNVYGTIESPIITPAIAVNASCRAIAVWTGDAAMAGSPGAGLLYFRKGNTDGSWGAVGQVPTAGSLAENPAVAWLDESRALCVWTHPKATPAPPPEGEDPSMPTGLELHWSIYQNDVWSAPQAITNDNVWDIRPVLASNGAGQATCVWQRLNQPNPNVEPAVPMILVASTFSGSTWTAPVSIAPGSTGVDYQASVRYDAQGNPGVAWLRDPDAFADTENQAINHMNQSLWYVHKAGTAAWSTPQQIGGLSAGAYAPSLDFDNAHQPCVVCLVPGVNKLESTSILTGGGGNQSRLWFARRSSGTWAAAELRRTAGIFNYPLFGERPTLRIDNSNRAIVVFRRFGQGGTGPGSDAAVHTTGDVGIATATLPASGTSTTWRADFLTDDGQLNWQIAYDRPRNGFCGKMFWVKGATDGDSTYFVNETVEDTRPDPAILKGGFTVSNPHPTPGQSVTWSVQVTNRGLITAGGSADPLRVEIRRDSPTGTLVGTASSTASIALGETATLNVTAAFPAGGQQRFVAIVLPPATQQEVTAANNTSELVVGGVSPPCNLTVSRAPQNGGTLLNWDPPAGTDNYRYRILRRTAGGTWEVIGYSLFDDFCDPSALPLMSYEYAIVAVDPSSGVISDACSPGFIVIPSLIPNDPGPMPALNIFRPFSTSPVTLSWLDTDPLLYIERSPDMSAGSWSRMFNTTGKSGANRTLQIPLQRPAEFYRLRRD